MFFINCGTAVDGLPDKKKIQGRFLSGHAFWNRDAYHASLHTGILQSAEIY